MKIKIVKFDEFGYSSAMYGLSLSHEQDPAEMKQVALRLINPALQDSHNKFREMMVTWWQMWLPRYMWQQFDTYRVGVSKQSGSTMYNILKREIVPEDFYNDDVHPGVIELLNRLRVVKDLDKIKRYLPEGYMQERMVMLNYQAIQHIVRDRKHHKLEEWQIIIEFLHQGLVYPEFINW